MYRSDRVLPAHARSFEPGMLEFGAAYLAHYDALIERHLSDLAACLVDGDALLASAASERLPTARRESRVRLSCAFEGDWASYDAELRADGRSYAALGLPLDAWLSLVSDWSYRLLPILCQQFGSDPSGLRSVLAAKEVFFQHVLRTVGAAFAVASQHELRRREFELESVFASMADAVLTTDGQGLVTRANTRARALLREPALIGKPLAEIWSGRLDGVGRTTTECELVHDDGTLLTIVSSRAALMGTLGEVIVLKDVSAARTRSRQLARWETLFQRIDWSICITDASGTTLSQSNDAFRRTYGFTAQDSGRTLASLFAGDEYARITAKYGSLARARGSASYEAMHRRADGSEFPVQVDTVRIPDVDGEPAWALAVHDLTERRQLDELRARSVDLQSENLRVLAATRLKSEFLANMSHELRTPLNAILGFSELLHNGDVGPLSDQQHEFVGDIHDSGKHLLRLINDILDLSKVEAGKLHFEAVEGSLTTLCEQVESVLRGALEERGVQLTFCIDPLADRVHLDLGRLKQVLYNYLSNAIKFSARGARVATTITRELPDRFRLEVADRGPGISETDLPRLFREFEQLDSGRSKAHGGTGLGLALTKKLVEAQGGSVGVRSVVGKGSTFFAVLPMRSSS